MGNTAAKSKEECLCDPGFTQANFGCSDCPEDTYKDAHGPGSCLTCPAHSTTNGTIAGDSIFSCVCDAGFTAVASADGKSFHCVANECDMASVADLRGHDFTACTGVRTAEKCTPTCLEGYTLKGSAKWECRADGKFYDIGEEITQCEPIKCEEIDAVKGIDFSDCDKKATDDKCTVKCAAGYSKGFDGENPVHTCLSNRKFQGDYPVCIANPCNQMTQEDHLDQSACDKAFTDDDCLVRCATGYYVPSSKGDDTAWFKCLPDATFSGTAPPCEVAFCPAPADVDGVDFSPLRDPLLHIGEHAAVRCIPGWSQTESVASHEIIPAYDTRLFIEESGLTGELFAFDSSQIRGQKFQIRESLGGYMGSVSISLASDPNKYLVVEGDYVMLKPRTGGMFDILATFFVHPGLDTSTPGYSLQSAANAANYMILNKNMRLIVAPLANNEEYWRQATFIASPGLKELPSTVPSIYMCLKGGVFTGSLPPACTRDTCRAHPPMFGVDFSKCAGAKTGDTCEVGCKEGWELGESGAVTFTCDPTGDMVTDVVGVGGAPGGPTCVPKTCPTPSWNSGIDASSCTGKTTSQRCFATCKPGFSSSALLVANRQITSEIEEGSFAACKGGDDCGCRRCGIGAYANYPCRDDPVNSCRNWCADTPGCKFFQVNTNPDHDDYGRCCRITSMPKFGQVDSNVDFFAVDADLLVIDASPFTLKTVDDMNEACGTYSGMSLVSVTSQQKLERVHATLAKYAFVNLKADLGVPIGFKSFDEYRDLANRVTDVGAILTSANQDPASDFFEKTAWTNEPKGLVGFGFGSATLKSFGFNEVQALVCERSFECMPNGELAGVLPMCTRNRCAMPAHPGVIATNCENKRFGDSCEVTCKANRENYDIAYDFHTPIGQPKLLDSFVQDLPSTGVSIGLHARVTTLKQEWESGALVTIGGSDEECCGGSLTVFTKANHDVGCSKHSGKFAIGFGSGCNSTGAPIFTACKFAVGVEHVIIASHKHGLATLTVNGAVEAEGSRSFAAAKTDDALGHAVSFLSGCHNEYQGTVDATVKHVRVWDKLDAATLTCGENGHFHGDIPCLTDTCALPATPLAVDRFNCEDKKSSETCTAACYDGIESTDIGYSSDVVFDAPTLKFDFMKTLPAGSPKVISFLASVHETALEWSHKGLVLLGGNLNNACDGVLYIFTQASPDRGCPADSGKFAIGFGVQCDPDDPPLFTPCQYNKHTTYSIKVSYGSSTAKIFVNDEEVASGSRVFKYRQTDDRGYAITVMNGWHKEAHEDTLGKVSDLTIYSTASQYTLTCQADGSFDGVLPICMDRVCTTPSQEGSSGVVNAVDYSDCFNRKSGESCRAQCNTGFSADGVVSSDVRMDAKLWLEASDFTAGGWMDHRGFPFGSDWSVEANGISYDAAQEGLRIASDDTFATVSGLNLRGDSLTMEVWVKLDKLANQEGAVLSSDDGSFGRSVLLHGNSGSGHRTPQMYGDEYYNSNFGVTETGQYHHFVGVWKTDGAGRETFTLYKNGVPDYLKDGPSIGSTTGQEPQLTIGRGAEDNTNINGWISTVRVYEHSLTEPQVKQLYLRGRGNVQPMLNAKQDVRQSSVLWLQGSDLKDGVLRDHRGPSFNRFSVEVSNVALDAAESALHFDQCNYLKINGLDVSSFAREAVTMEAWVKVKSIPENNVGWLIGNDNGDHDRSILLHDQGGTSIGDGIGSTPLSSVGAPEVGEWMHLVAVWTLGGESALYKNGFKYHVGSSSPPMDGFDFLVVGRHPDLSAMEGCIDAWVSSIRVYGRALNEEEVKALYLKSDAVIPPPNTDFAVHGSILYLDARDITADSWQDHRGNGASVQPLHYDKQRGGADLFGKTIELKATEGKISLSKALAYDMWVKVSQYSDESSTLIGDGVRDLFVSTPSAPHGMAMSPVQSYTSLAGRPDTGRWMHLAAVFRPKGPSYLYKNGIPYRVPYTAPEVSIMPTSVSLGGSSHAVVSVVRVYNQALTHSEVRSLYQKSHWAAGHVLDERDDKPDVRTCSRKAMSITCVAGRAIHVKAATYGRTSADVQCNPAKDFGLDVVCRTPNALALVTQECEGKGSCSFSVDDSRFGSHCADTTSYLDVDYECQVAEDRQSTEAGDIRHEALTWLEAGDISYANSNVRWVDHRGAKHSHHVSVTMDDGLGYNSGNGGVSFQSGCQQIRIEGVDVSGSKSLEHLTVETWYRRSASTTGATVVTTSACGDANTHSLGLHTKPVTTTEEAGQWVHLVGVWSLTERRTYSNGLLVETTALPSGISRAAETEALFIGSDSFEGTFGSIRIYGRSLMPNEIASLYLNGPSPTAWMSSAVHHTEPFKCQNDGLFQGNAPTCKPLICGSPAAPDGVDVADCDGKASGETCHVGCKSGYYGTSATFEGPQAHACTKNNAYDRLVGKMTLHQCREQCLHDGVRGCAEGCEYHGETKTQHCNAIAYDTAKEECVLYAGCQQGTSTMHAGVDTYLMKVTETATMTCGVFGQFTGTQPSCKAEVEAEAGGLLHSCEGTTAHLQCGGSDVIHVKHAMFGRTSSKYCASGSGNFEAKCTASGVMDRVVAACEGKSSCDVFSGVTAFGDPCEATPTRKYLEIDYTCKNPDTLKHHHRLACDSEAFHVSCSGSHVLSIKNVMYGRQAFEPCPVGSRNDLSCSSVNASEVVHKQCNGQKSCTIGVNPTAFGEDPCPLITKYLDVDYECVRPPVSSTVCQGDALDIQCESGEEIHIETAVYGRTSKTTCAAEGEEPASTTCSSDAFNQVAAACEFQRTCSVGVTNDRLGDPCNETSKYLEVVHKCRPSTVSEVQVCRGQGQKTLSCSVDRVINVRTVAPAASLSPVQKACEGKGSCQLDEFTGIPDNEECFSASFQCRKMMPKALACQGESVRISCPRGKNPLIKNAFFGRTDFNWCAHPDRSDLACSAAAVYDRVMAKCTSFPCNVAATTEEFGDPCPGTFKYLTVDYDCQ
jgi:hypothetical protein